MLLRPLEEIAHIFQDAFCAQDYYNDLIKCDWANGTITIEFTRRTPTSDQIRDTIFRAYQKTWGGKPAGMEVVYKRVPGNLGTFPDRGVQIHITSNPAFISTMLRGNSVTVLDHKEFDDWRASWAHNTVKRAQMRSRNVDPGEPVPVFRTGLFKI